MWQINEVLQFDGKLYRILAVNSGEIVWICLDLDTARPERRTELELISYFDEGRLFRHVDPFASINLEEPLVGSVAFNKREQGLLIIQPIIVDELCFEPKIRAQRVEQVRKSGMASIATIYKLLRRYWQRGQKPNSLLPDYKNSGAPGKTRAASGQVKIGRSRKFGDGEGMKVTPDIERLFRLTIEKYILSADGLKTTVAYRRFSDLFEQYYPQVEKANRPTIRQFRYFYNREYKKAQRLEARTHPGVNDGNKRSSLALGAYFLELNGFDYIVQHFVREMENIAVWVADNVIDKELLHKIISSILYEDEYSISLKLEIYEAVQRAEENRQR